MPDMQSADLTKRSGHAALRRGRRSDPGQIYIVTAVTARRRPWFTSWSVALAVARELGAAGVWRGSHVHAWVLMPDHMHALLTLGGDESLSHLMARVKAVSAKLAGAAAECDRPFWSSAFHDRALRRNEEVAVAARYIILNPVRARLVNSVWEWSFWDSEWLPVPGTDGMQTPDAPGRGFRRSYTNDRL